MGTAFEVGDVAVSLAGRDRGALVLVVDVGDEVIFVVDGKLRKTGNPKKKSIKHLKKVSSVNFKELANKIISGAPVNNGKVKKVLCTAKEKI